MWTVWFLTCSGAFFFTTKDKKKDKVQVPQRNEMLFLYFTALGFISKKINLSKIPTTMRNVFKWEYLAHNENI